MAADALGSYHAYIAISSAAMVMNLYDKQFFVFHKEVF